MLMIRNTLNPTIKPFFDIFDDIFEPVVDYDSTTKYPLYNTIENDNEYIVELELAGIKKEDIGIETEKNKLTIKAERTLNEDFKYNVKQITSSKYIKTFTLPESADKENISASFVNGILEIKIPKTLNNKELNKKMIEIM